MCFALKIHSRHIAAEARLGLDAPGPKGCVPPWYMVIRLCFAKLLPSTTLPVQMSNTSTLSIIRPSTWPTPTYIERCEAISTLIAWNKGLRPERSEGSKRIRLYSREHEDYNVAVPCGDDGCTAWWVFNADHREGAHLNG